MDTFRWATWGISLWEWEQHHPTHPKACKLTEDVQTRRWTRTLIWCLWLKLIIGFVSWSEPSPRLQHDRRKQVETLRCVHLQMNACSNTKLYKMRTITYTHTWTYMNTRTCSLFWLSRKRNMPNLVFPPKNKNKTDWWTHAFGCSIFSDLAVFSERCSHLCFCF